MKRIIKRLGFVLPVLLMVFIFLPGMASAEGNEASVTVGETVTPYATFQEAVSAAQASEGSTLTLLQNVTVGSTVEITSGDLTLDLNGFQIRETIGYSEENPILRVASGAKLTVTDLSGAQAGEIGYFYDADNVSCPGIGNNGTLILNGGTVTGHYGIYNTGTVVLNGGMVRSSYQGSSDRGFYSVSGEVTGYAATIDCGIYAQNTTVKFYGTDVQDLKIVDGSLYAEDCDFGYGKSHINLKGTNADIELHNTVVACLVAMSLNNCDIELTGCTIEGGGFFSEGCMGLYGGSFTAYNCVIKNASSGNTFTLTDGAKVSLYGTSFDYGIQISGGTLNNLLPEGWEFVDKDGNPITFDDADTVTSSKEMFYVQQRKVASVTDADGNTTRYVSLTDAVAAAQSLPGSTVKPLENMELDSGIEITTGTFTLDLNGFVVECIDTPVKITGTDVNITVMDSSAAGTGTLKGEQVILITSGSDGACLRIDSGNYIASKYALHLISGNVTINGGMFSGGMYAMQCCSEVWVSVNGGSFYGSVKDFYFVQNSNIDHQVLTLCGGVFEDGISIYCSWADLDALCGRCYFYVDAEGNRVFPADGDKENAQTYTLAKFVEATVTVGDTTTEYPYLSEALAAAEATPGSVLKLRKDFALSAPVEISAGSFVFDLNGHTLSAGVLDAIQVAEGVTLTLTDSADEPGSVGNLSNAGSLRLENISGSALTSTGDVTLAGYVALPEGVVLVDGALLELDGLAGTNTYTVELEDADGDFATGEFASAADGSALDAAVAARFASTRTPGYMVRVNADGKLEIALVTVEVLVTVIWQDHENAAGVRPQTVEVAVLRDGQTVAAKNISEGSVAFVLAKFDGESEITYTLGFPDVEGYEKKVEGSTVTYTHVPAPTQPPATNGSANTADFAMPGLWVMAMLACAMGAVAVCKRMEI